jgi:tRNA pseudouridine32 synthase/23S rRNA pseudouridine746 synthase
MLNARGESKDLVDIWRDYHTSPKLQQRFPLPPGGSGDCCAPKLLQCAYQHHWQPVAMAEFWMGESPRGEIRHDGHYYPACRGKCLPILTFMLQGLEVEKEGSASASAADVQVVYEDAAVLVVDKPSGMLSVPGRIDAPSVQQLLAARYGEVFMPHRLDMDTSGLLVVARNVDAYKQLQSQFYARTIYKRYMALLDGYLPVGRRGTISLPMRPDPLDRPRQVVDYVHGKQAVTDYEVLSNDAGRTLVSLIPHTGRTHQLRVHCAHPDGLGLPIVGDPLYGRKARRLCLHAAELAFTHPVTGERMKFVKDL